MNKKSIIYKTLELALSLKRPHGTQTNKDFTDWLARALPEHLQAGAFMDGAGNLHVDARCTVDNRTLFVAHVDTVHKDEGHNKIRKERTTWHADGAQLGADDGAGVAMLMHLLHAKIAGYYIFTQGEERGGIGAKFVADNFKPLLGEFDRAIAFDRRGIDSVISHQGYGRCCSDAFAQALADDLNGDERLMYSPDDTGVYTDTAEFTDIIPECTNISVGYYSEHTLNESLDIVHYQTLASRVIQIAWDTLPTDRDPSVVESKWDDYTAGVYYGGWASYGKATNHKSKYDYAYWAEEGADITSLDLQDALQDAIEGYPEWLIEMMAESVYPEDIDMAVRFIDKRRLTVDVLQDALNDSWSADPSQVLATLFDSAYMTV